MEILSDLRDEELPELVSSFHHVSLLSCVANPIKNCRKFIFAVKIGNFATAENIIDVLKEGWRALFKKADPVESKGTVYLDINGFEFEISGLRNLIVFISK